MSPRFLRTAAPLLCVILATAAAAVRPRPIDFRASATLDEIAKRRESRAPPIAPPRMIHEPGRINRTRGGAPGVDRGAASPHPMATSIPASYGGFLGLRDNFTAIPPDTMGAVGRSHIVTMLNTQVSIQSRDGIVRQNYPISLDAFWSPLGVGDTFDPRIQYDAAADRWIACAASAPATTSSVLLVAVSQTADPGGAWNYYKMSVAGGVWGDYPVLGFNGNWVVVSLNLFRLRNDSYQSTSLYVFNKADLYRAGAGTYVTFSDNFGELIPALDFDNRPDVLYFAQASAGSRPVIRLSKLQGSPGQETFLGGNGGQAIVDDSWADSGPVGDDFGPQLGSSVKIDLGDSRMQNCVQRSGTIWCAQTIFLPAAGPTRSAVQWFQIDPTGPRVIQRGRLEDPTGTYFYSYPSIAVNRNTDMAIGFTRFSATEYASAGFAFRVASDPAGALQTETIYKRGEASYIASGFASDSNRWGDYSVTLADPTDDLTFWTLQEYAVAPPGGQHGQFGTWWAKVTAPSSTLRCTFTLSATSTPVAAAGGNGTVAVSTGAGCPWMAASNAAWLQVTTGSPGTGSGSVGFSARGNSSPTTLRSGTITIAGQTFTVTQSAAPAGTDLAVTAVNAPSTAEPGRSIGVTATVMNQSTTASPGFRIGLYLGAGSTVATRDTLLASCAVSGLAGGASATCSQTVTLPSTLQPGRYALGAIADDQGQIADPNPANNTRVSDAGALTITTPVVRPAIPGQGIVSAASYQGGGVAPGEVVTLFGTNLGPATAQFPIVNAIGFVETIAGGTRVLFDGVAAPMIYALAGQVSTVVPFSVQNRASTQVQVEYLGTRSDPAIVPVLEAKPAIFTVDRSGKGAGAILNQDLSVNSASNPARRGAVIAIYATGGGVMAGVAEGRLTQPPLTQLSPLPVVRIGGVAAQVTYAGGAPGIIAGVLQINVVVPGNAPTGAVPIDVAIEGATSPAGVTVAVQ